MGARRYKQSTCLSEDEEDRVEGEKRIRHPFSPRPPTLHPLQQKGCGDTLSSRRTQVAPPPHHQRHSTNFNHSNRQIKINLSIKINLMLLSSVCTRNPYVALDTFIYCVRCRDTDGNPYHGEHAFCCYCWFDTF